MGRHHYCTQSMESHSINSLGPLPLMGVMATTSSGIKTPRADSEAPNLHPGQSLRAILLRMEPCLHLHLGMITAKELKRQRRISIP